MVYTVDQGHRYIDADPEERQAEALEKLADIEELKQMSGTCDDIHDVVERLRALEQAVAVLATEGEEGEGEEAPTEDLGDPRLAAASPVAKKPRLPAAPKGTSDGPPGREADIPSSRLPSIEDINAANRAFWSSKGHTTTGGSGSLPPNSTAASSGGYLPNQAGTIGETMSETRNSLDQGKRFGVTADSLKRGEVYRHQRIAANRVVASINQLNAKFYGRTS
jgi:hypothetical protein